MSHAFFIAGTDTEVGKTFVTCTLLHHLRAQGLSAIGMKPIASGTDENGCNDDVERLVAASSVDLPRRLINPWLFAPSIAPHIAAQEAGVRIEWPPILTALQQLRTHADVILVEGVGGFCVPLNTTHGADDLAQTLALPVVLVVGMRLGCINHALLTQEAIAARGLPLVGWVANTLAPEMNRLTANIDSLRTRLKAPLLGIIPSNSTPEKAASCVHFPLQNGKNS